MRDGAILRQTTPQALREQTGDDDLGQAFLAVIEETAASEHRDHGGHGNRVLRQIRHDPRTVALLLVVPAFLLVLLRYVFDGRPSVFQAIGGAVVRAVSVHRDVPGHLDRHAARAHQRDA